MYRVFVILRCDGFTIMRHAVNKFPPNSVWTLKIIILLTLDHLHVQSQTFIVVFFLGGRKKQFVFRTDSVNIDGV